ncbi:FAD-dependent oxidoreductase [Massilia cavernae]|uniref:FAD-dependent oxidoreductase n=1 Tax=Massilia cavernae TaxID=2320864 RepID=A0A418XRX8_9BURK|nr:FAD-dependent oxidoreductase [Massilia cavernae]RJG15272.1 FAD-dependent oxidoreductase [Massilia cavernae]
MAPIVIIGAGMAAYGLAREFRKLDKATPLTIVTGDSGAAYAKPMLSNAFALGKGAAQLVSGSAEQMAAQLGAEIQAHTTVLAIDTAERTVVTDRGSLAYSKLVLALGANPIRLPLAGDAADAVLSVNHIADYAAMRERLAAIDGKARVAILGAGLIGCEFADDLSAAGHQVTLVDPNPRPLAALAAPGLSEGLAQAWQGKPVLLALGTTAASVSRSGAALQVTLADGRAVEADVVLSAVGLRPSIALAQSAQLLTRRGIVVDQYGRTSCEDVYALGDCAEFAEAGVLPYVAPMLAAARAIASTLAGTPVAIELKTDAVIVKTPSYRLALAPPPVGTEGEWVHEVTEERTVARFVDADGAVRGFGLSAPVPAVRQKLLAELVA